MTINRSSKTVKDALASAASMVGDGAVTQTADADQIRLNQLLRDKALTRKTGFDVEGPDYGPVNAQIKILREKIKSR